MPGITPQSPIKDQACVGRILAEPNQLPVAQAFEDQAEHRKACPGPTDPAQARRLSRDLAQLHRQADEPEQGHLQQEHQSKGRIAITPATLGLGLVHHPDVAAVGAMIAPAPEQIARQPERPGHADHGQHQPALCATAGLQEGRDRHHTHACAPEAIDRGAVAHRHAGGPGQHKQRQNDPGVDRQNDGYVLHWLSFRGRRRG